MAYREGDDKTWTAQWYETDLDGVRRKRKKRGFLTKRSAVEYEVQRKLRATGSLNMKMSEFIEVYFDDKALELKPRSIRNKRYVIARRIEPFFGNTKVNDITPGQIISWQKQMSSMGFKPSYLRMMQKELTALFTHAVRVYDLKDNPCRKVKKMGKAESKKTDFWTLDEYKMFIGRLPKGSMYYVLFEVLFWTGCRIGEALALTPEDIDLGNCSIRINKTFFRSGGKDILGTPKTEYSERLVDIPVFLQEELKSYLEAHKEIAMDRRIFPIVHETVQQQMKKIADEMGLRKIRVHDLRHSHVAYLISNGVDPYLIKERLGHKDIRITLNTYGHLYPDKKRVISDMLDKEYYKWSGGRE